MSAIGLKEEQASYLYEETSVDVDDLQGVRERRFGEEIHHTKYCGLRIQGRRSNLESMRRDKSWRQVRDLAYREHKSDNSQT